MLCRICPLNFTADMISTSAVLKDRVRTGASLADVDPMEIDKSVSGIWGSTFSSSQRNLWQYLHHICHLQHLSSLENTYTSIGIEAFFSHGSGIQSFSFESPLVFIPSSNTGLHSELCGVLLLFVTMMVLCCRWLLRVLEGCRSTSWHWKRWWSSHSSIQNSMSALK